MKKQLPYFLIAFSLPVIYVLWWWGLFAHASVEVTQSNDYHYAYLEAKGPYSKLVEKQDEVLFYLKQQHIHHGAVITLLQSDPRKTNYKELEARTGYVIDSSVQISAPLRMDKIPAQQVVSAKIKAHPLIAYGKTYSALLDYLSTHDIAFHLPTIETYNASTLTIEMPIYNGKTLKKSP